MSFVDQFARIERDKLLLALYSCTAVEVERALMQPEGNLQSLALGSAHSATLWGQYRIVLTTVLVQSLR